MVDMHCGRPIPQGCDEPQEIAPRGRRQRKASQQVVRPYPREGVFQPAQRMLGLEVAAAIRLRDGVEVVDGEDAAWRTVVAVRAVDAVAVHTPRILARR